VSKFASGELDLGYEVLDVSSETSDEEVDILKDGQVTHAAKGRLEIWERDKKVFAIFWILGFAIVVMFIFAICICIMMKSRFDKYQPKHHGAQLTNLDTGRSDIEKK
jgi:hypothetical protein